VSVGYGSLVLLLGTAGLRWSEAAALRLSDIDFLRRRIELHRNAVTLTGQTVVGTLKSGKARTVPLAGFVVEELAATCKGKDRDELIWPSATGGYLPPPGPSQSWLAGAVGRCQQADATFPRITAHALRHTAASLAISAGANVKVVQRMLGHASAAMTLDVYADLFDDDFTEVAQRLDETVGKCGQKAAETHLATARNHCLPAKTARPSLNPRTSRRSWVRRTPACPRRSSRMFWGSPARSRATRPARGRRRET
jgi:integrase